MTRKKKEKRSTHSGRHNKNEWIQKKELYNIDRTASLSFSTCFFFFLRNLFLCLFWLIQSYGLFMRNQWRILAQSRTRIRLVMYLRLRRQDTYRRLTWLNIWWLLLYLITIRWLIELRNIILEVSCVIELIVYVQW